MTSPVAQTDMVWIPRANKDEKVVVISFDEDCTFDEETASSFLGWISDQYTEDKGLGVVLDMSNVDNLSSFSVGILVAALKEAWKNEGGLKLCCLRPRVQDLLHATHLDRVLDVHATVDVATKELAGAESRYVV